jgi:hypothetical protein
VHHVQNFYGLPAFTFPQYASPANLPDPGAVAWRLQCGMYVSDENEDSYGKRFTELVELEKVRALILGYPWYSSDGAYGAEWVIGLSSRLTSLEAVFLGDLEVEEAEVSWIGQEDLGELLETFVGLKELTVRGGEGLSFPLSGHKGLRALRVESGGMPPEAAAAIAAAPLPSLERLELWLGDEDYGGGTTVEDLAPLLAGEGKPALRHLGLQNSPIQDELAAAVASAPIVAQLTSLSLSMGILTDAGAEALLRGQPLNHLRELDLSHHYLSDAMMLRIWTELESAGVRVDLTGKRQDPDWNEPYARRYIAVSE